MAVKEPLFQRAVLYGKKRAVAIWDHLGKNNLWKRILKNVTATTLLISICLIPGVSSVIGQAAYLGAIITVFGHPGRRFGQMAEALILVLSGAVLGTAWSILGIYLASLVIKENPSVAYAIRGFFLAVIALVHGYLRSRTPRLFVFVLLLTMVSIVTLTSTTLTVTPLSVTGVLYPILLAVGCITLVNICIFPEFSSRYLGQMTLETLNDTVKTLGDAGFYFAEPKRLVDQKSAKTGKQRADAPVTEPTQNATDEENRFPPGEAKDIQKAPLRLRAHNVLRKSLAFIPKGKRPKGSSQPSARSLTDLTNAKAKIRKKLADCKGTQEECNFELAVSVLPPLDMKAISVQAMEKLVADTIAVISACESKFALLGDEDEGQASNLERTKPFPDFVEETRTPTVSALVGAKKTKAELEMIKPKREIEFGDARLLRYLLSRVAQPYKDLHAVIARTVEFISACIAYAYDVPTLPSGARAPKGILLTELDMQMDVIQKAIIQFDADAASALKGAATLQELEGKDPDIMPREEVFVMSSFLLNVRHAASHIEGMLKHSRELVGQRQHRNGRRRIYAPHIKWSKWLHTGGDEDEALPNSGRRDNRKGVSNEGEDDDDDDGGSLISTRSSSAHQGDLEKNPIPREVKGETKKQVMEPIAADTERQKAPYSLRLRGQAADVLEWIQYSEDLLYAMKFTVAVMLVSWPAFVPSWNAWFSFARGLWAALQLVFIAEVSIGTSIWTFILRAAGTTAGCLWGWAAVEARGGNPIVSTAMICVAVFPCAYIHLGSKYPKAGMVCIVSMSVVSISSQLHTVPGRFDR